MVENDCSVYVTTDSSWYQIGVYSAQPFNQETIVDYMNVSTPKPTESNPLSVEGGNYVLLFQKDSQNNYKIFVKEEEKTWTVDESKLSETCRRLDTLEKDGGSDGLIYRRLLLPSYYTSMPNPITSFDDDEYLQKRIAQIPEGRHFIFVTDTHWDGTYNGEPNNNKKSNLLIQYVRGRLGNVDVVFGGDVINANPTKYQAANVARQYFNECIDAYGEHFIPVLGNHDSNVIGQTGTPSDYEIPYSELAKIFTTHLKDRAVFRNEDEAIATKTSDPDLTEEYKGYFKLNYVVNTSNGITIIVYNTGAHGSFVRENFGIHGVDEIYLHQKWLYNVLMNIPAGNDVVLCGHEETYGISDPLSSWNMRSAILQMCGLAGKKRVELYQQSYVITEKTYPWIPNTQYPVYDFTNAPTGGKVFALQGHWHHDYVVKCGFSGSGVAISIWDGSATFTKANGEIPIVTTICDAAGQYRNEPSEGYITDPVGFTMESGTVTEQAFDVVTITDTGIVTTRFGAAEKPEYMQRSMIIT